MARVLVVDDEPRILSFVSRALASAGFAVEGAEDGEEALKRVRTGRYDLVILDLLLPGLDGVTVLRHIMDHQPDQRVLVLSALSDVETKVRCLETGTCDYLSKPFALAELIARVRTRLHHSPGVQAHPVLKVGDVTLDLLRRTVDAGRGPIALSEREFLLLQHFMRRPEQVCTRQELLSDVWGYDFDPGSNVVDVYVARLRAKLGNHVIETVRNVGYCFRSA